MSRREGDRLPSPKEDLADSRSTIDGDLASAHGEGSRLVGRSIAGRYRIEEAIGRGGLGAVFRVEHLALGKSFALKVQNPGISQDVEQRRLFFQEAKLASSIVHPSVISVVDFGEDERVGAFMVMEYVPGESLAERLREYPRGLPIKVFCDVMKQLAEALQHIHDQGIVHGDIKAGNVHCFQVVLSPGQRRRWQVKVLDFGMASLRHADHRPSTLAGTPAYLAPERILGGPPTASADLYSLGVLGYELLTGRLPFEGAPHEVIAAQVEEALPSIARQRGEDVDQRAVDLIAHATSKDPDDRHADMSAFLYELRTLMHMLGMAERRRRGPGLGVERTESRWAPSAARGFELAPLPMAGINTDGAVVIANKEFARLVAGDENVSVRGDALCSSPLLDAHPTFLADVRQVFVTGARRRMTVRVPREKAGPEELTIVLGPGAPDDFADVHLTVIPRGDDEALFGGATPL